MLEVGDSDVGRPFQDLSVSYRPVELSSPIDEVRRQARPIRIEHQEYHRPPAEPIRLTIDVAPLISRDGRQFAVLLTFTDTTRTFEELETTNEELRSANEELESTNDEVRRQSDEFGDYKHILTPSCGGSMPAWWWSVQT